MRPRFPGKVLLSLLSPALLACASGSIAQPSRGPIALHVDATEAPRKILHAKLSIPVGKAGPLTLLYAKWIPGEHGPTGPLVNLAGLKLSAGGRPVPWRRDSVNLYAIHCEVPAGASTLEAELDFLSPAANEGFSGGASATAQLVDLSWNQVVLYPEGAPADAWTVTADLRLPAGWKYGTALDTARTNAGAIEFKPVSLSTLVDSPLIAGSHFKTVLLPQAAGEGPVHAIDLVSDSDAALEMSPDLVADYRQLVAESGALFGARHYRSYHFLYTLSDHVATFGLEHHESSDDRSAERTLLDEGRRRRSASLLPHEFVHSWNGKYRRPEGLLSPTYQEPMKGDLLWVYEGLTEYLGDLLTARSGLWSKAEFLDDLALTAASLDDRPGRTWRPLEDTAIAAQILYDAPSEWESWRRSVDYYPEGQLLWLEVDVVIRQVTSGKRSLDDFCRRFHGGQSGPPEVKPYTFDDVVKTLGEVAPYDWKALLLARLTSTSPRAPLGGVTGGGYKLVYSDVAGDAVKGEDQVRHTLSFQFSLGLLLREEGGISDVIPGSPAARAGLAPGMRIVAVNGRRWSADGLHEALKAAKTMTAPLELLVENGEFFKTYAVDYHDGDRYPHLERDGGRPDVLGDILKPLAPRIVPAAAPVPAPVPASAPVPAANVGTASPPPHTP